MKEEGFFLQNFVNMLSSDVYRLHFEAPNNPKFGDDELMSQKLWESRLKMMFSVKEAMDRRKVQRHLKLPKNGCVDLMVVGEDTIKSLGISTFQVYEVSMKLLFSLSIGNMTLDNQITTTVSKNILSSETIERSKL